MIGKELRDFVDSLIAPAGFPYGPYWRFERDSMSAFQIQNSGQLWGNVPRIGGIHPTVEAFGENSQNQGNVFFFAAIAPDRGQLPGRPRWEYDDSKPLRAGLFSITKNGVVYAAIDVRVVHNSHCRRLSKTHLPANSIERRKTPHTYDYMVHSSSC